MPELVPPHVRIRESFCSACAEEPGSASGWRKPEAELTDPDAFAGYVQSLLDASRPEPVEGNGFDRLSRRSHRLVPGTTLWWVDGTEYLGRVSIRHRLNERLTEIGGHIGYWVRPSARRQGHGLAIVRAALPIAYGLGIDPALITCDADNVASRRIIERVGGVLDDRRADALRYWVLTGGDPGRR